MNLMHSYCKTKYYAEYDSTALLIHFQDDLKMPVTSISHEMFAVLHKLAFDSPCSYWDKKIAVQVLEQLEDFYVRDPSRIKIDESAFDYYTMGCDAYCQISETIDDMRDFNISQEIKTRMFRLPTYTSIVEGCLSNLLRVIAAIVSQFTGKDYTSQTKLKNLLEMAKKNGFPLVESNINVNLRNAINHGRVSIRREEASDQLHFYYVENGKTKCLQMAPYEFDNELDRTYDVISGVLMGVSLFINNHVDIIGVDKTAKSHLAFKLMAMELSLPNVSCLGINDTGNDKQINIEVEVENTDRAYLGQLSVWIAYMLFYRYSDYQKYLVNFSSPRMQTGFIRYMNEELREMNDDSKKIPEVFKRVIERKDYLIFPVSEEEIDVNEAKYFCFPNCVTKKFKVSNIADASTADRKRLRAHLFVGEVKTREELLSIIDEALNWLKDVKNPPSPTFVHKHGKMPADALYVNVYKEDRRKDKNMFLSNENFICFVDYNASGKTTLKHGGVPEGIWMKYLHETIEKKEIAWRDSTYYTRHVKKINRNDLCPCGSGVKYKNCCGK